MRKQYNFSKGRRRAVLSSRGRARITIMLDHNVLEHFRSQAEAAGIGYQTLINAALRESFAKPRGFCRQAADCGDIAQDSQRRTAGHLMNPRRAMICWLGLNPVRS